MDRPPVHNVIVHYLARYGICRSQAYGLLMDGDEIVYEVGTLGESVSQEDTDKCARLIPLVVPGAEVTTAEYEYRHSPSGSIAKRRGRIRFTWSRPAMWRRIKAVFAEYGVADERVAYMTTQGGKPPEDQPFLPGTGLTIEPYATANRFSMRSYTPHAIMAMDAAFCQRISQPNRGGEIAYPGERMVEFGDWWWFVGSRGDSVEVMDLEIKAAPLPDRYKENLLDNLHNMPPDEREWALRQSA